MGEELYYHTHGIDMSIIQDKILLSTPKNKSYGIGQTLFRDYYVPDIFQIIIEMVDEVTSRLRYASKQARTITLGIGYSKSYGSGFNRQVSLESPTASPTVIYQTCLEIFHEFYEAIPIRRVHVSLSNMSSKTSHQMNLFEDIEKEVNESKINHTIDKIKYKHGKNMINRASSEFDSSTAKKRNDMIGGHNA